MAITLRASKGSALSHAELDDNFEHLSANVVTPFEHGGVGDGTTNDRNAILSAFEAAVDAGKAVDLGGHTWLIGSQIALDSDHNDLKVILRGGTIKKEFSGDLFTLTNCARFSLTGTGWVDGQHGTYTGKGFVITGSSSSRPYFGSGIVFTSFTDSHIEFGADSGEYAKVLCDFFPGTGQTDARYIHVNGPDTNAANRLISQGVMPAGYIDLDGAWDTIITASSFRRVEISSDCNITHVVGCTWGNSDAAMTISGGTSIIVGNRMSGNITLDANFSGQFGFNHQTSGTFTNNATFSSAVVYHHAPSSNVFHLGNQSLRVTSTVAEQVLRSRSVTVGDADATLSVTGGAPVQRYTTTLTANRTVTLSTTNAQNGDRFRVVRTAGDSGGTWTVSVGGLKSLSQNQWCDVEYTGSAWVLTAYGTL
jgi:hypothetical protein